MACLGVTGRAQILDAAGDVQLGYYKTLSICRGLSREITANHAIVEAVAMLGRLYVGAWRLSRLSTVA